MPAPVCSCLCLPEMSWRVSVPVWNPRCRSPAEPGPSETESPTEQAIENVYTFSLIARRRAMWDAERPSLERAPRVAALAGDPDRCQPNIGDVRIEFHADVRCTPAELAKKTPSG